MHSCLCLRLQRLVDASVHLLLLLRERRLRRRRRREDVADRLDLCAPMCRRGDEDGDGRVERRKRERRISRTVPLLKRHEVVRLARRRRSERPHALRPRRGGGHERERRPVVADDGHAAGEYAEVVLDGRRARVEHALQQRVGGVARVGGPARARSSMRAHVHEMLAGRQQEEVLEGLARVDEAVVGARAGRRRHLRAGGEEAGGMA